MQSQGKEGKCRLYYVIRHTHTHTHTPKHTQRHTGLSREWASFTTTNPIKGKTRNWVYCHTHTYTYTQAVLIFSFINIIHNASIVTAWLLGCFHRHRSKSHGSFSPDKRTHGTHLCVCVRVCAHWCVIHANRTAWSQSLTSWGKMREGWGKPERSNEKIQQRGKEILRDIDRGWWIACYTTLAFSLLCVCLFSFFVLLPFFPLLHWDSDCEAQTVSVPFWRRFLFLGLY